MCGRFVLVSNLKNIQKNFNIRNISYEYLPSWNIMPNQLVPAVISCNGINQLVCFRWGLIPSWSKDPSIANRLINARAETLDKKPSFRDALKKRRCLIIADGFYEWKREGKSKIPLYFYLKSGRPFGFAGLYETWMSPDKKEINTCVIITTGSNELIAPAHDRMPVIFSNDKESVWLEGDAVDTAYLLTILKPYPACKMDCKTGMGPHNSQEEV
jgi:putative SOS response-associated peptidase YedK